MKSDKVIVSQCRRRWAVDASRMVLFAREATAGYQTPSSATAMRTVRTTPTTI